MPVQPHAIGRPAAASTMSGAGPEPIDIARIRLSAGARSVAVLGEFRAADRLLLDWVRRDGGSCKCDVEVTFLDGFVFCGRYEYRNRGRGCGRPSVSQFVRSTLQLRSAQQAGASPDLSRYAVNSF